MRVILKIRPLKMVISRLCRYDDTTGVHNCQITHENVWDGKFVGLAEIISFFDNLNQIIREYRKYVVQSTLITTHFTQYKDLLNWKYVPQATLIITYFTQYTMVFRKFLIEHRF